MKKALLIVVVLLIAVVAAAPFLVPVSSFIPELTRIAAEKLGQPVVIEGLKLHLLPTPRVIASGISVGRKSELTVGELEIVPELPALLSGEKAVRLLRAEKVVVQESAFAIAGKMPKTEGSEPVPVRRIEMKDVTVRHSKFRLPPFDADFELADQSQGRFRTSDGAIDLRILGTLKDAVLDLPTIDGKLYGGTIAGSARADWTKQWQVAGKASLAGVDLVPVQKAMGKPAKLSGRLKTQQTFSSRAKAAGDLVNALSSDGPFEVVGGAYTGVDLTKVADLTGKSVTDATQFEEFKGKLQVRGQRVKINELCVKSPKLVAGGNVEIAPDQKLSGKMDVSLAKSGGFVGVPVALSGTTADPSVRPTKGYMIGAAVGTILLPGIGTSLGASAGSRMEGSASNCR